MRNRVKTPSVARKEDRLLMVGVMLFALPILHDGIWAADETFTVAPDKIESGVRIWTDVAYSAEDPKFQKMDVYAPNDKEAHPILVFVHGGGWYGGDKSRSAKTGMGFAQNKVLTAVINYRLAPQWKNPAAVQDLAAAIAWLRKNAASMGGDARNIFVVGHSTGTHSAALVVTDPKYLTAVDVPVSAMRGAIMLDGCCYLMSGETMSEGAKRTATAIFGPGENAWLEASPERHLSKGSGTPPFLVVYASVADKDRQEAKKKSAEDFAAALGAADVPVEVLRAQDSHGQMEVWFGTPGDAMTGDVLRFIHKNQSR